MIGLAFQGAFWNAGPLFTSDVDNSNVFATAVNTHVMVGDDAVPDGFRSFRQRRSRRINLYVTSFPLIKKSRLYGCSKQKSTSFDKTKLADFTFSGGESLIPLFPALSA